ncbi:MAG: ribonuclease catalytic domain-containing protein [Treponema sp.]|nr:ribonuclease catalytic domain-containing protein [Treponema sp.]
MIAENALVIYKNKPAIVKDRTDGKYSISLQSGESVKVRDKDIEVIHPGPIKDFNGIKESSQQDSLIRDVWELLSDEGALLSLKDLTGFIFNEYTPSSAYAAYCLLCNGLYFSGTIDAITPRSKDEVSIEESKRTALQRETDERAQFLERLKSAMKNPVPMQPDDARFIQDVEALAYGKTAKSRTMKDLGIGETPEDAHVLLLKTGFWTGMINPHPSRFGLSLSGAGFCPEPPCSEERRDLCHLAAFAIDSSWSTDPDDAVSIEKADDEENTFLYVHVADLASSITFDSPAEKEARDRGATLYLPEGTFRMLAEDSIPLFAIGYSEKSPALTFKLKINNDGEVVDTEIFPSVIKAQRLTYEEADSEIKKGAELHALYDLAQKIFNRRTAHGAVNIELPDIHIYVENGNVNIKTVDEYQAAFIVKECMIAAGEGAGTWAASRGLAFPYISQEVELQPEQSRAVKSGGFAGSIQLRKCMRPRILSTKPGRHQGLGLDTYTQVTSPLRRYTDLLAHIQIRAVLRGNTPLSADEISARLGFSEAGAIAAVHAERASDNHWKMVFLSDKKESVWDAIALENKGNRWAVIIPALALETQVALQRDVTPNDDIKLILKSVNIPKGEAVFVQG